MSRKIKKKTKLYEWQKLAASGGKCAKCGLHKGVLTVDHIIPVAILQTLDDSGMAMYEDEDNFQLLCHPCNQFKGTQLDKTNHKTKELLLKYINNET